MFCNVISCRYPHTHISEVHRCRLCNMFGHGEFECGDETLLYYLRLNNCLLPRNKWCSVRVNIQKLIVQKLTA